MAARAAYNAHVRAFLGASPDSTALRFLREHAGRLRAESWSPRVRWTAEDTWHLTVRFLGEITSAQARELGALFAENARAFRPFDAIVSGPRWFSSSARPRALVCEVGHSDELAALASACESSAMSVGLAAESRAFRGHITLGRVIDARDGTRWRAPSLARSSVTATLRVAELTLFRSEPGAHGSRYFAMETFPLGARQSG